MNEESGPEEGEIQDPISEQMETEEEELPLEEATFKLIMGVHVGPANYQPPSPRYVRVEEDKEEDDDVEAPYLAPKARTTTRKYSEGGPLTSSGESIPALIDLEEDTSPQTQTTSNPMRARKTVLVESFPPPRLSIDKGRLEKSTPEVTQAEPRTEEEVPEENIIYIDDDL